MSEVNSRPLERPLTALVATIQDGRFLKLVFLSLLALSVATVFLDLKDLSERSPSGTPGSQTLEPAPMELPQPGDQTRPYLPRTMPLGPGREKPDLPGYFGPLDGTVMGEPLQFHLGDDGRASALGRIDPGAADRFEAFLDDNPKAIGELFLHSPGGSVSDALAISRLIREAGISTRVPKAGYCASSCPLLLAGGLYRSAGEPAFIGVHQVYAPAPGQWHVAARYGGCANGQCRRAATAGRHGCGPEPVDQGDGDRACGPLRVHAGRIAALQPRQRAAGNDRAATTSGTSVLADRAF